MKYLKNIFFITTYILQKQSTRGVLIKRCSENMQQSYRRTPMPMWDFNKITLRHGCSPVNLLHIFRTTLEKSTSGGLVLISQLSLSLHQFKIWWYPGALLKFSYIRNIQFLLIKRDPANKNPGFLQLQLRTKYLRKTLVFIWNSALQEKFNFCFQVVFS